MIEEKIERLAEAIETLTKTIHHVVANGDLSKMPPTAPTVSEATEEPKAKPKAKRATKAKAASKPVEAEVVEAEKAEEKAEPSEIDLFGDSLKAEKAAAPLTEDDIRKAAMKLVQKDGNSARATEIILSFGVKHIVDVKQEAFPEVMQKLQDAIAGKG